MSSMTAGEHVELGQWTQGTLDQMLARAASIEEVGLRIEFVSGRFLGVPYEEHTLIGDAETPEIFTIDLQAVDCFTYVEYVEAMRLSRTFTEFKANLKMIRYAGGEVSYTTRNHFFTDWRERNSTVSDVTGCVGRDRAGTVVKRLNEKTDGTGFVSGIATEERDVTYVPARLIDGTVIASLQTGDYIGFYAEDRGLDVSHVGVIVKDQAQTYLRHASSAPYHRKVIDEEFMTYVSDKPGIVVLRPRAIGNRR
jgi:hypothetical protein